MDANKIPGNNQWLGRGRGFPPEQYAIGRGRGLLQVPENLGAEQYRDPHSQTDNHPRQASLLNPEPVVGHGRGLLLQSMVSGGVGRARELHSMDTNSKVGAGRGAMLSAPAAQPEVSPLLQPAPGPAGDAPDFMTKEASMPTLDQGSTLVSMFRGMGIETGGYRGRGAPAYGRGVPELGNAKMEDPPSSAIVTPASFCEPEMGRGSGFRGQTLPSVKMMGLGRAAMPQVGQGRGQALLSPSPPGQITSTFPPAKPESVQHSGTAAPPIVGEACALSTTAPAGKKLAMEVISDPINKAGTKGESLHVGSNHIPVRCHNEAVYQYHVVFNPNIESMQMRFAMMKGHRSITGEVMAFDGSVLYLPVKLEQGAVLKSVRRTDNVEIEITIQMTKILPPNSDLCIPFYNVVLRRVMKIIGLKVVGRNHFDPESAIVLGKHRLQVWPGFSTSIKRTDGGLYLCVDVTHKVLRNDSVMDVMNALYHSGKEHFQDECTKELVGSIVITRYNNRTYRVDDIDWTKSPKDSFSMINGTKTTFVEYYSKNYGITITEMSQPLLVHRPKDRSNSAGKRILSGEILLVPELSFMTGIPDKMRKDFRTMKDLTMHINVSSEQHTRSIKQLLKNIHSNPESRQEISRWGLEFDSEIPIINGRTLPRETICFQSTSFTTGPDVSWSREIMREASISAVPLDEWVVLYPRRCGEQVEELVSTLAKVAGPLGMRLVRPNRVELRDDRTETYVKNIQSVLTNQPNLQMVVCILVGNKEDLYSAIKKLCCLKFPIPSQAINWRTISQQAKLRGISQKILLQINCKMGGELWTVNIPLKSLMVIGVDVHHDTSKVHRSVMGFVASVNSSLTRWYSRVIFQPPQEELISGFRICLMDALHKYYQINHNLPEKIVVYRDGVSEGQLKIVESYEIPQLMKCFETFPDYEPKLVFIVVQKRINTTLYACASRSFTAPPPGTVVDHTLTHKNWVDFYLTAHSIRQGCGLPTHYICLCNTANLSPDHLQRFTFKMCHLYWNWPGTIRVPAPCKYAHKLAFLSGQHLHSEPGIQLCDKLYYL